MINKENRKNYSKYTNKYIIIYLVNVSFFWLAAKKPKDFLGFCWICLDAFLFFVSTFMSLLIFLFPWF